MAFRLWREIYNTEGIRVPKTIATRNPAILALLSASVLSAATNAAPSTIPSRPLVAPVLQARPGLKQIEFRWQSVAGATSYQLFHNPDGHSGFAPLGAPLSPDSTRVVVPVSVHLQDWPNAQYRLEACNATGCLGSASISPVEAMIATIGYFKPSNTGRLHVFGTSVALSADGTTLAVGGPGDDSSATGVGGDQSNDAAFGSGAVYVFTRSATGWTQQAYLKASNTGELDLFGTSLAISADGRTIAVGAHKEDSASIGVNGNQQNDNATDSGAVYVFVRGETDWAQQAYIKSSHTQSGDLFGSSLALSADGLTLAVSATDEDSAATGMNGNQNDDSAAEAGAVYVFGRNGTQWTQQAYVKASNAQAGDRFGTALSLSAAGDTLAVSAPREDGASRGVGGDQTNNNGVDAGAVYTFARTGGQWAQQAYIKASNTETGQPGFGDEFGSSLALSGNGLVLAVGAPDERSNATGVNGNQNDNSVFGAGAVYVFTQAQGQWSQESYVKASNTQQTPDFFLLQDFFGTSVALSADGSTLAVGARGEDSRAVGVGGDQNNNNSSGSGAAYVFKRDESGWSQRSYVKASNTSFNHLFGSALALNANGSTLAVSAPMESSNATGIGGDQTNAAGEQAGAVYLY